MSWVALGRDGAGVAAYALDGETLAGQSHGATDAEALAGLNTTTDRVFRIGDGTPDTAPCAVLPHGARSLPVITQDQPADVMGAWVRVWIAGFLAGHEGWDGVVCTQMGDVTHWVHISAGEVVSFLSFLTPRLISVLNGAATPDLEALADTQSRPEKLAAHLRLAEVTSNAKAITGHLIGAELAAARAYWLGQQVAVIAPTGAGSAHALALTAQGVPVEATTPKATIAAGLAALSKTSQFIA